MSTPSPEYHLVVVDSSAGGIDALSTLVATLPKEFSAPILIAQHLDPTRQSHLGTILGRRSVLPVRTVTDQEPLQPGTVYVVPANRNVTLSDHMIRLQEDQSAGAKPSIDRLFSSAAQIFGDRLIAVILSGTGSDGAAGARLVKKAGGTVIIQDPDTAAYPGMPLALAPTTVDIIANLDRIGTLLGDLLSGVAVPTRPAERQKLESFLHELQERQGLDFTEYKTPTLLRRLRRRIVATESDDLDGYIEYLRTHPDEWQQLINSFLIKVTEFFRDPELFDYLRESVLPDLIAQARRHGNELRIWSAGCATGEEAYSLAILVSEALGSALEHFSVRIFATDADPQAIAYARRGTFPGAALAHLSDDLIARYFTRDETGAYQIKKRVRMLTVFGQHDLAGRAPFPNLDMVVCRNVLIYFTNELQQRTLRLFAYSLRNNGYLVLGKAETPGQLSEFFALQDKAYKVYRREGDRVLMPTARFDITRTIPQHISLRSGSNAADEVRMLAPASDVRRVRGSRESALSRLPLGVVVVDRHYDIQMINGVARRFLGVYGPTIGEDLIHLSQHITQQRLREAIDGAFRRREDVIIDDLPIEHAALEDAGYLQVRCHPQTVEGEDGPADTVLVLLCDVTAVVRQRLAAEGQLQATREELERTRREMQAEQERAARAARQLLETNRQLLEANQELTATNEELRSTNEEFLMNAEEAQAATEEVETLNEELQATNEELETLNEELQATNEELETLNEELQSTIEELNTTNDDLNARSMELQEMARISDEERARLETILAGMGDAVLVVNEAGAPVLSNAAYDRMLTLYGGRLIPLDFDGNPLPQEATPMWRVAHGESFLMEFILRDNEGNQHWYEANGQNVHGARGQMQWGVLVFRDITERSLRRIQDEFISIASHELRTPLTPLQTYLQMLAKQFENEPEDALPRRYTRRALEELQRLSRLVNDLLDVRRLQSGVYALDQRPLGIDALVEHMVEVGQAMANGQVFHLESNGGPLAVVGDQQRLEQVLLNLFSNAIRYAPGTARIDVRLCRRGGQVEVQVQDYGPGIAPADLPQLFTRFYQGARARGRGGAGARGWGWASTSRARSCARMAATSPSPPSPAKGRPSP